MQTGTISLTPAELELLKSIVDDKDGMVRSSAVPSKEILGLNRAGFLERAAIMLSGRGGVSVWRVTEAGKLFAGSRSGSNFN